MLERWKRLLEDDIHESCEQMMREPAGILTHPYTVPSTPDSPYYSSALWDWDSWFISAVLGQVEADTDRKGRFFAYEEGCILNFLEHTDADGVMPIQLKPEGRARPTGMPAEPATSRRTCTSPCSPSTPR